jgi:hypothetical protein
MNLNIGLTLPLNVFRHVMSLFKKQICRADQGSSRKNTATFQYGKTSNLQNVQAGFRMD